MAPGTWVSYNRCVDRFIQFLGQYQLGVNWPVSQASIILFISFLSLGGWAPSSINSHMAAISFVHKANGWCDPTDSFLLKKLKEGTKRGNPRKDSRLPISPVLLAKLVRILTSVCNSSLEVLMFKAAFLLAFFGFLRVGEFTSAGRYSDDSKSLTVNDVSILPDLQCLQVTIRYSKTDQRGSAVTMQIGRAMNVELCPVKAMWEYLQARPPVPGLLFRHFDGSPLTASQFNKVLKKCVEALGLSSCGYSAHSLRIGAATSGTVCGLSEEKVKELGRWKSSAYKLYIRTSMWDAVSNFAF